MKRKVRKVNFMENEKMNSITLNILIKKEEDLYVGHCLELDIVTADASADRVRQDMKDLIIAQIDYAFSNDNLENLFCSAPQTVWKEFYTCEAINVDRIKIESKFQKKQRAKRFVPPWIIAKTCLMENACVAQ